MKRLHVPARTAICLLFFASVGIFSSCSRAMGYSVLLWDYPEAALQDGTIVPVYIRSNISHVYVIGIPGTKEKVELPLWQLSEPQSMRRTRALAARYAACRHRYARVKNDGLPIHAEASNVSRNVYRLRKDEVVKLLYEGQGQPVMVGQNVALEGTWFYVLTTEGTRGWCFSYNLAQFETDASGNPVSVESGGEEPAAADTVFERLAEGVWYPEEYRPLIAAGTIDLTQIDASFYFKIDRGQKAVVMRTAEIDGRWPYDDVTKRADDSYQFDGSPVVVTVHSDDFIVVRSTDVSGRPQDRAFIRIAESVDALIAAERARRSALYAALCAAATSYRSAAYGTLLFAADGSFEWRGYDSLVPSLIPRQAGAAGVVEMQYIVSRSLARQYDGVLTFRFNRAADGAVSFLYSLKDNGLRLEDASGMTLNGAIVTGQGLSPLVLFFEKQNR
ncbi:MAG: SH3 domain-containing protein [Treponema sp.]|nr:SH3 domain-containing protein [Treponema sp.]